ncbi:hypothetical protein JTB14_025362 [Gonioctena quinquepunctata]|nr:hypothetical protein JTB14_025362 [Gonioctena quinquepunctata]
MRHVDPTPSDFQLAFVKNTNDDGTLIGCKSKDGNTFLENMVQQKLSDSYVIRQVGGVNPRVQLVGLSDHYTSDTLQNLPFKCNKDMFSENSDCKVVKIMSTKKNDKIFQAIIRLMKFRVLEL